MLVWRHPRTVVTRTVVSGLILAGTTLGCGPPPSAPAGAATQEELAALVQAAVTAGDRAAMERLHFWDGASDDDRERQTTTIEGYFQGSVESTEFLPMQPGYVTEFIRDGMLNRPNLPLDGHLRIRYGKDRTGPRTAVAFPYGRLGDRFYLPVMVRRPVDSSDPESRELSLVLYGQADQGGPVAFEGTCHWKVGDVEQQESFSGNRDMTRAFWGRHFTRCTLRKTSSGGFLQFRVKHGRDVVVFDSEAIVNDRPYEWVFEGATSPSE